MDPEHANRGDEGGMRHPYARFEGGRQWQVVNAILDALVKNGDILEITDRAYIAGYFCQKLESADAP